jgi:hypothetical protein
MPRLEITIKDLGTFKSEFEGKEILRLQCEVKNTQDLVDAIFKHLGKGYYHKDERSV